MIFWPSDGKICFGKRSIYPCSLASVVRFIVLRKYIKSQKNRFERTLLAMRLCSGGCFRAGLYVRQQHCHLPIAAIMNRHVTASYLAVVEVASYCVVALTPLLVADRNSSETRSFPMQVVCSGCFPHPTIYSTSYA